MVREFADAVIAALQDEMKAEANIMVSAGAGYSTDHGKYLRGVGRFGGLERAVGIVNALLDKVIVAEDDLPEKDGSA